MAMAQQLFTIGQLAKRVGLRPSALRFYEAEGLLQPQAHSAAGYRLYGPEAAETLRFIQRAQRLGFALADIRVLLDVRQRGVDAEARLLTIAEERYLALEQQLTPLLALRHELALFLQDLRAQAEGDPSMPRSLDAMLERICSNPFAQPAGAMLDQLLRQTGCVLHGDEAQLLLARLRGHHIHLWQEGAAYHILVVSADPAVGDMLSRLAELEAGCHARAHSDQAPELLHSDEGFLLVARGAHAFLFARLFLALETDAP